MKVYDLTIKCRSGEILPAKTYYSAKGAMQGLRNVKSNGIKVIDWHLIDREATAQEIKIYSNLKTTIQEMEREK